MIRSIRYQIKLFSSPRKEFYSFIKSITGFSPLKFKVYDIAFIHKSASYVDKMGIVVNNERLEYLGDAVLDAVVADYLYNRFPGKDEGFMTQLRSRIVNRNYLTQLAFKMGLDRFVKYNSNSINESSHLYGDLFEAFIGAIYLDAGYETARRFIIKKIFADFVDIRSLEQEDTNFKSQLIEWGQKNKQAVNFETTTRSNGSNSIPFKTTVTIDGVVMGIGEGYSKKEAQQNAARKTLDKIAKAEAN